jgi:hypothetical protein
VAVLQRFVARRLEQPRKRVRMGGSPSNLGMAAARLAAATAPVKDRLASLREPTLNANIKTP